jgi:SAM-dependent methyltransferase
MAVPSDDAAERAGLLAIVARSAHPAPWREGDNIPWHDPGFSARMLREHLTQEHDAASRRMEKIDRHVAWIHEAILSRAPADVLDLGCGPGLYTSRLAALGHRCRGIDYSPASIRYAREQADALQLACRYVERDVRDADFGSGHALVMMLFGEPNVFRPEDLRAILRRAHAALREGGVLLLEPHRFEAVERMGDQPPSWYSERSGLFADAPHLCLTEHHWDRGGRAATTRFFVIDAASGGVTRYAQTMQAYEAPEYEALLEEVGFANVRAHTSLTGRDQDAEPGLCVLTAVKIGGEGAADADPPP